jgi:hopanoid biosynthesis associated RND transporter like protein HpnN
MIKPIKETGLTLLNGYISLVGRFRLIIILSFVVFSVSAVFYTAGNLGMNTNTKDMLSPQLQWRQLDLQYEVDFPQYLDNILLVIEADTPDQSADAAILIYNRLRSEDELFKSVYYPSVLPLFRENGLLYLSTDELYELSDNLARIQPFLSKLTNDMSLRGLFAMLTDAIDAIADGEVINIDPLITELTQTINASNEGSSRRVSWQNLIDNNVGIGEGPNREFIILSPVLDKDAIFPGTVPIEKVREILGEQEVIQTGASISLTGSVMLSHEELSSVTRGTEIAMLASLIMVTIIMIGGLRSLRLVAYTLLTLITGLIFTATFATVAIGELNLISVAFAVLYIGLGIDFAIHYCLRYRELLIEGQSNNYAIEETSRNLGHSLFICTLTTALGFFAFVPTQYRGVAELGLISGVGMFISLFVTLTLLPALLGTMPLKNSTTHVNSVKRQTRYSFSNIPIIHASKVRTIAIGIYKPHLIRCKYSQPTGSRQRVGEDLSRITGYY